MRGCWSAARQMEILCRNGLLKYTIPFGLEGTQKTRQMIIEIPSDTIKQLEAHPTLPTLQLVIIRSALTVHVRPVSERQPIIADPLKEQLQLQ